MPSPLEEMIQRELLDRGISDARVLEAFRSVPRDAFVDEALRDQVWGGHSVPIGEGQTLSQPFIVGLSLQLVKLKAEMRVLEIGTGSGYQTALLSLLCRDVYTIERSFGLHRVARQRLEALGFGHIKFKVSDGTLGWADRAPFDAIVVSAGAPAIPPALVEQMAAGGRMVIPVGPPDGQRLMYVYKGPMGPVLRDQGACDFVALRGVQGWKISNG